MFIASNVFDEAMDEDNDAARGIGRRVVSASIERSRLGTGEPGFGEAGHGCVKDGSGEYKVRVWSLACDFPRHWQKSNRALGGRVPLVQAVQAPEPSPWCVHFMRLP